MRVKNGVQTPYIKHRMDGPTQRRWMTWARWWWINNRGPVPAGQRVVFLDGNSANMIPENIGCVTPGDVLFIAGEKDPSMIERNRKAASEGTARFNRESAAKRRRRHWLPTRWYAVFVDRGAILNLPTKSRCDLLRLFGVNPLRNGRVPGGLPFEAVQGDEIANRFPGFRRLSRPPADARAKLLQLYPPIEKPIIAPNPSGLCQCGCGRQTALSKSESEGITIGQHRRFVQGHWANWVRQHVRPDWGAEARQRCLRIAEEIAKESTEFRWEEVLGPAFEAALDRHSKGAARNEDLRTAAKAAVKRYFTSQITYGHASVEALSAVGWEPSVS